MATRRVLKAVAHDVAESIVSRNDDIGGYWALGQLLSHAFATKTSSYAIDLMSRTSRPSLAQSSLSALAASWSDVFWKNVEHQRLGRGLVGAAAVLVNVDFTKHRASPRASTGEQLITCRVQILDDQGKLYSRSVEVWCAPHDPRLELKSAGGA